MLTRGLGMRYLPSRRSFNRYSPRTDSYFRLKCVALTSRGWMNNMRPRRNTSLSGVTHSPRNENTPLLFDSLNSIVAGSHLPSRKDQTSLVGFTNNRI